MAVLGTNEKYSALFVVATEMQVSIHTKKTGKVGFQNNTHNRLSRDKSILT